jgi:hypothetical protein
LASGYFTAFVVSHQLFKAGVTHLLYFFEKFMLIQISGKEYPQLLQRYSKLPDKDLDKLETLADEYLAGTVKSSALPLLGGVGIGLYIGSVSVPIVGAIAGSGLIYGAISSAVQKGRNAEYIKDAGVLAPFLREQDLVTYADLVGVDAVLSEISQAYQDKQKVSPAARRFMRQMGQPLQRRTIARYVEGLQTESPVNAESCTSTGLNGEQPNSRNSTQQALQQVGQDQDASPQPYKPGGYFDLSTGKGSVLLDLLMQSPGVSRLMIGGQRTGKSYFAAVASRELARLLGWKIFHINLASYGIEDSYYWTHAYKSVCGDLSSITNEQEACDLIANAIDCITEFINTKGAILIVDEVTFTGSKYGKWDASKFLRLVAEQISALTSSGMKRERVIWALCPELVAGAIKDSAKAIKSLKLLYFAIVPGLSIDWQGQKVKFDEELHKQITANYDGVGLPTPEQVSLCRRHGLPRIAYMNGEWLPVGELPKIEQPSIAKPSAVLAPSPFRKAADYLVMDTPKLTPIEVEPPPLPQEWEAIGRAMLSMNFTTEQPGTIRSDGTKEPINSPADDPIELAILEFLKSRPEGATAGRIRADKKALKTVPLEDIEFYLSVLVEEGKIQQEGAVYHVVDRS